MCRLLGIVGTPPLPAIDVLAEFFPLAADGVVESNMKPGHLDGWGLSGYSGGRAVYFDRRATSAVADKKLQQPAAEKAQRSQSPVILGHLRKSSDGKAEISNTLPVHARDWIFAHSGTIYNKEILKLIDSDMQGQTDSERFGLWAIERVRNAIDPTAALVKTLKDTRQQLVFSALNFLMSDGKTLWAYREYGDARFDPGETLADREKYYTLFFARVERSAVVCSEKLKNVSKLWQPLAPRTLAVFSPLMLAPQIIPI